MKNFQFNSVTLIQRLKNLGKSTHRSGLITEMCMSGNTVDTNVTSHIHSLSGDTSTSGSSSEDYPSSKKTFKKKQAFCRKCGLKISEVHSETIAKANAGWRGVIKVGKTLKDISQTLKLLRNLLVATDGAADSILEAGVYQIEYSALK